MDKTIFPDQKITMDFLIQFNLEKVKKSRKTQICKIKILIFFISFTVDPDILKEIYF